MHIFISVDIEGVAGVSDGIQGQTGNPEYEVARRLMTQEANAAIRGAFAGGATEVTVADSHGKMRNMIAEDLDPRARVVAGIMRPLSMIEGIEPHHAGVILIGYHAAASNFGVLAHTISGLAFQRIEINGQMVGEPTLFGGYAAQIGVPLLAVSGDQHLAAEIANQFPNAKSIVVKNTIGAASTNSLSPQKARELIEADVTKVVRNASGAKVDQLIVPPLNVEIAFTKQAFADGAVLLPFVQRKDALRVTFVADNYQDVIGSIMAMALISSGML
ncbi:M55 family metallopeptidase [Maritalea sp.]|uniref:M55 family metallopeptidase n=1 Tax=Maritalea sp. TaxID=2003361 RepID=UPI003EF8D587